MTPKLTLTGALGALMACVVGLWLSPRLTARPSTPPATPLLTGEYRCTGSTQGKQYTIGLRVETYGSAYLFVWYDRKGPTQRGYGVRHEDAIGVAIVAIQTGALGVGTYRIGRGSLTGTWAAGADTSDPETCLAEGTRSAN